MLTSSPESFHYAVEGYFDNKDDDSRLLRLQTFYLMVNNGAKIKKPEQLWFLPSDKKNASPIINMTKEEYREWYKNIAKRFKVKDA